MRYKLFYVLFFLYIMMVLFILFINGVFTGEVTSISNLLINVGFLFVIGVMFAISAASFGQLHHFTDSLEAAAADMEKEYTQKQENLWNTYRSRKGVFGNEILDDAFHKYQKRMNGYQTKKGLKAVCDLEEYINAELVDSVAMNHYNSAVSGTMTGLGILGTFLGLSMGLGSFDGNNIYTISDNVGPLLEGMKVAFHTSVYGIFFSLVFNFIYRSIMAQAYESLNNFLDTYREYVSPQVSGADENYKAMLIYQANMCNSMKQMTDLLKGNAMEQTAAVERIVSQFTSQMTQSMGADFEKLGRILNYTCKTQEQCSKDYQSMEETTRELQAVNQVIQKSLVMLVDRQEAIVQNMKEQEELLSTACKTLNDEISNQLYTYNQMREMYEK